MGSRDLPLGERPQSHGLWRAAEGACVNRWAEGPGACTRFLVPKSPSAACRDTRSAVRVRGATLSRLLRHLALVYGGESFQETQPVSGLPSRHKPSELCSPSAEEPTLWGGRKL